jgi:hypothetical protein
VRSRSSAKNRRTLLVRVVPMRHPEPHWLTRPMKCQISAIFLQLLNLVQMLTFTDHLWHQQGFTNHSLRCHHHQRFHQTQTFKCNHKDFCHQTIPACGRRLIIFCSRPHHYSHHNLHKHPHSHHQLPVETAEDNRRGHRVSIPSWTYKWRRLLQLALNCRHKCTRISQLVPIRCHRQ